MSTDPRKAKDIFVELVSNVPPEAWENWLEQYCPGNEELRSRVRVLLRAHAEPGSFLEQPAVVADATILHESPICERPGTVIGPYKLREQIGEGGMGIVYVAEQTEPVKRKVALKLIKPGMDSRQVVARFEAERQALAMMDHPNIARVLDAGVVGQAVPDDLTNQHIRQAQPDLPSGRPYFVMELVKGVPITKYCDEKQLPFRARLELFVEVCRAVQHAHQKGIIHRDIKPNNVLVAEYDNRAVPKVIDFGVAKATAQKLTERTMFTEFGQVLGTMEYMSPEQSKFNQLDIDTRSDIYSLGVLLYELLAGSTPFEGKRLHAAAFDEMLRIIREEEPPKPSTRLSSLSSRERAIDSLPLAGRAGEGVPSSLASIAANRHTEPARLSKEVQGELDWIVMKALEKDRNRRYETASGFAADIERHLHDEPVEAGPPSAAYRFRKFAKRNKAVFAFTALVVLALLTFTGGIGWSMRDRAARQMAVEEEVHLALREAEQWQEQAKWPEALSAAKRAEGLLAGGSSDELRERVQQFRKDLDMVLRLEEFRAGRQHLVDHEAKNGAYARLFAEYGIEVESLSPQEVAARIARRPATAVRVAGALDDWAMVLRDWGLHDRTRDPAIWKRLLEAARLADPDPWRSQLRQLTEQRDLDALRKLSEESDITALPVQSLQQMGNALIFAGDGPSCVAWLRKAHRQHPGDALISFDLAFHLSHLPSGDTAEALRFAEAGLAAQPSPFMYDFVGNLLYKLGRHDEAAAVWNPDFDGPHYKLGRALSAQGKLDEAIACYRKAIEVNPKRSWAHNSLGAALDRQGKPDEAIAAYQEALRFQPTHAATHFGLASALVHAKQWDRSASVYSEALQRFGGPLWPGKWYEPIRSDEVFTRLTALRPDDRLPWIMRARVHVFQRDWKRAAADYARASEFWTSIEPARLRGEGDDLMSYACLLLLLGDRAGYEQFCKQWADRVGPGQGWEYSLGRAWALSPQTVVPTMRIVEWARKTLQYSRKPWNLHVVSLALYRNGKFDLAIERAKESNAGNWRGGAKALNELVLAMAHHRLGHTAEARIALAKALELANRKSPDQPSGAEWADMTPADLLEVELLRREVEDLIDLKTTQKPDQNKVDSLTR